MNIEVDLSKLWNYAEKMGDYRSEFSLSVQETGETFEIDKGLSSTKGLDIALEDLESNNGVLSVAGRQVLLFIPDQGSSLDDVLDNPEKGRRFHVAECITLDEMRRKKRFERYKATYNIGGIFEIYGTSYRTGEDINAEARLCVCKNCLKYLNYKGYESGGGIPKRSIFNDFDIAEFLSEYSTLFKSMPSRQDMIDKAGYSDDWEEISIKYRKSVGFKCEECRVNLEQHKHLLHAHHINGNKRDNRRDNLSALCIDCHRKQPQHDYMRVRHEDRQQLVKLRRQQGLLTGLNDWDSIIKMADKALDGLLRQYAKRGVERPEVDYELRDPEGKTIVLEVAWPRSKRGIAISDATILSAKRLGWYVLSVGEALRKMNET